MDADTRKPIILLAVVGVIVVVVFVLGVGLGGGSSGAGEWRERLSGFGVGGDLAPQEVSVGEGCGRDGSTILVAPACVVEVAPRGGRFSLGSPVRKASLTNAGGAVRLTLRLEDTEISRTLDPGESTDLTFGPDGGSLVLQCQVIGGCAVSFG